MSVELKDFLSEQIEAQKAKAAEENKDTLPQNPDLGNEGEGEPAPLNDTTPDKVVEEKIEKPAPIQSKIKVEYQEWLETNKGTIQEYLNHKDKDYTSLSHEEAVALKLKRDNPYFNSQDVKAELQEKYGIGLSKVEIDRDIMSTEEIKEAERTNSLIERGQRVLKAEGEKAKRELEEYKSGLTLPELEYEVSLENNSTGSSQEEVQEQIEKYRNEVWVPELSKAVVDVGQVKRSITIEDNGEQLTLDVEFELSKEDQETLVKGLTNYVPQASDAKYSKEDGTTDVKSFLQDKAQEVFVDKLLAQVAKQAYNQAKKGVIKNDLLNFDNGIKPTPPGAASDRTKQERVVDTFFGV